jgi:hypothetical protein
MALAPPLARSLPSGLMAMVSTVSLQVGSWALARSENDSANTETEAVMEGMSRQAMSVVSCRESEHFEV